MSSVEPRLDLTVTANTGYSKWIAFTPTGYYYMDGAGNAVTTNNNTGNFWTAVYEKAVPYFSKVEFVELRVNLLAPAQKVSGTLSAYKPVQHCLVTNELKDQAFGSSLEGFSSNVILPPHENLSKVLKLSQEAKKNGVPAVLSPIDTLTLSNAGTYKFQTLPVYRVDPASGNS